MKGSAMIISKSNQRYELPGRAAHPASRSGDGGGQAAQPGAAAAAIAGQRWEDDGGRVRVRPPVRPVELGMKATWSTLSLRDLHRAIRLAHWPDNAADV
jgi:hypothetical protein